ncbi:phospholipase A2-like [Linepithema humile]|uniref:phospholipase A2-like n=1 Tax=Linepithema humile TaxID=83485 RepID=UPI00351E2912
MSRVRVCLFVLFLVLDIAVQFGDCEDTTNTTVNCDEQVPPGSDETRLSYVEWFFLKFDDQFANFIKYIIILKNEVCPAAFNSIVNKFEKEINFQLIFPGTLWCGDGDRADNENDLGEFNQTDACCRAHDNCKNDLVGGKTQVNLKNNGIFTRTACNCDNELYDCLKNVDSVLSKGFGETYFNLLGPQCFKCVCPTDSCNPSTDDSECKNRCNRYTWVDNRSF